MSDELVEALKEFARTVIQGELMTLVSVLGIIAAGINTEVGTFVIQWNLAGAVFAAESIVVIKTAIMAAIDKFAHEKKIETPLDLKVLDELKK